MSMTKSPINDSFYLTFEEKYRGLRTLITTRLEVYRQFVAPLLQIYPCAEALDLGCGRGEWLVLMAEWGFQPLGIDQDAAMLLACEEIGLKVEKADAIAHLRELEVESQSLISAFHLVEHLPFDDLRTLVAEAMRVLKPGGLLIMETPNPDNLIVATRDFYLDPTHQRPIPCQLLAFVAEYTGFVRVKTLGLQESKVLSGQIKISLADVFHGVSPDYAVIAQKHADAKVLSLFEEAFGREYGLSKDELLAQWDKNFYKLIQQTEAKATQAEAKATQVLTQLCAVYVSTSWRITAPIRIVGHLIKKLFPEQLKPTVRLLAHHSVLYVKCRPPLCRIALAVTHRFPFIRRCVLEALGKTSVHVVYPTFASVPTDQAHLTLHARQIYADLKSALEKRQKENY
ncbi:MAG: class I SAM-dependent methyltransferase [Chlorobium sp.]|nr:class I SAM-dependent methyltransferase [Chlorobium sp.]